MAYPFYGYQNQYPYMQSYQNAPSQMKPMEWVDGEIGAKAFQRPADLPPNTSIPLWDSGAQKIYVKSWNQVGMANPMYELEYTIKENQNTSGTNNVMLPAGQSGQSVDNSFVTKEDFDKFKHEMTAMKEEIMSAINSRNYNGGNRNGKPAV